MSTISPSLFGYLNHAEELMRSENSFYSDMPKTDYLLLQSMTDKIINSGISARVSKTLAIEKIFA